MIEIGLNSLAFSEKEKNPKKHWSIKLYSEWVPNKYIIKGIIGIKKPIILLEILIFLSLNINNIILGIIKNIPTLCFVKIPIITNKPIKKSLCLCLDNSKYINNKIIITIKELYPGIQNSFVIIATINIYNDLSPYIFHIKYEAIVTRKEKNIV